MTITERLPRADVALLGVVFLLGACGSDADIESSIDASRAAHPEFAGKTVSFFNSMGADGLWGTSTMGPALLDELAAHPIFSQLPAVTRGAYIPFYVGDSTSMVQPSALSLPFALDELVPQMADSVAGS
jgi:hypothetical protein